jgi:hypothetical protein
MSTEVVRVRRIQAVLNLPEHKTPAYVSRALAIVSAMTGNPNFPSPTPPLGTISSAIEALADAEAKTLSRASVTFPERDQARFALHGLLLELRFYVQRIADGDAERATAIIESAGMYVKRPSIRPPRVFKAKRIASGAIALIVPSASKYASYEWAISHDEKETWASLPPTKQATTTVRELTPGSRVYFRYRAVTPAGPTDWRDPISIIVG